MRSMTHREYEARLAWIDKYEDVPSRDNWYMMQVAAEVRRSQLKNPSSVSLKDMKLKKEEVTQPVTLEEATARAKTRWYGMLGIKGEK